MDAQLQDMLRSTVSKIQQETQTMQEDHNKRGVLNGAYSPGKVTDYHLNELRSFMDSVVEVISKRSGKKEELAAFGRTEMYTAFEYLKVVHDGYMKTGDAKPSLDRYAQQAPGILEGANVKLQHSFTPRIPFDWSVTIFGLISGIGGAVIGAVVGAYLAHVWK